MQLASQREREVLAGHFWVQLVVKSCSRARFDLFLLPLPYIYHSRKCLVPFGALSARSEDGCKLWSRSLGKGHSTVPSACSGRSAVAPILRNINIKLRQLFCSKSVHEPGQPYLLPAYGPPSAWLVPLAARRTGVRYVAKIAAAFWAS